MTVMLTRCLIIQIERSFKLWAAGVNPSPKKVATIVPGITKRFKEPFNEEGWGGRARDWVKTAGRLAAADWDQILGEVNSRVLGADHDTAAGAGCEDGMQLDSGAEDARTLVEL